MVNFALMLARRRYFSLLSLAAYSLVLLHNILPHFHVDGKGQALMSNLHQNHHDHREGYHTNVDHEGNAHHASIIHGFAHFFDGLFHVSSDENHLVHTATSDDQQILINAELLFLLEDKIFLVVDVFDLAENSNNSPPYNLPSNYPGSSRLLRAPPSLI